MDSARRAGAHLSYLSGGLVPPSLSLRTRVCHPNTRTYVRLLGPCFKTGHLKPFRQHLTALPAPTPCPTDTVRFSMLKSRCRYAGHRRGLVARAASHFPRSDARRTSLGYNCETPRANEGPLTFPRTLSRAHQPMLTSLPPTKPPPLWR